MNEEELKATIGEAAFAAMSAEQRSALMGKFTPEKKDPPAPGKKTPARTEEDPDLEEDEDPEEDDLVRRARRDRIAADRDAGRTRRLESSIKFNLSSKEFLKANESLLPKEVNDLFAAAEKENYADATEKADAIKAGLIQSFFAVQANVDLLTPGQKATLDDYLKLTKNGKQEKAQVTYDMIFEPAFEMLKATKKAEQLNRGHHVGSTVEEQYKNRLISGSKKHYRLEKK